MVYRLRAARRRAKTWLQLLAVTRALLRVTAMFVLLFGSPEIVAAQPVKADVSVTTSGGFARIVFQFPTEISAAARVANGVLVVSFGKSIDIPTDRLAAAAPDYISVARRDPDGMAIRIALAQSVRPNLIPAGERIFLDLLPGNWTGAPPTLPESVVQDLARRAREAEKKTREQEQLARWRKASPIRVRVAKLPTLTRYVFPLTGVIPVASESGRDRLDVVFHAPLRFDFADALADLPPYVTSIDSKLKEDGVTVHFALDGKVDLRVFREDNDYVVDIAPIAAKLKDNSLTRILEGAQPEGLAAESGGAEPSETAPQSVPARVAPAAGRDPPRQQKDAAAPVEPASSPAPAAPSAAAAPKTESDPQPASAEPRNAASEPPRSAAPPASHRQADAPGEPSRRKAKAPAPHSVKLEVNQSGDRTRLYFPFAAETAAAVFRRGDTLWMVFDADAPIDISALQPNPAGTVRSVAVTGEGAEVIRIKLDRPRLSSLEPEGTGWAVTLGDVVENRSIPVVMNRSTLGAARSSVVVPFKGAARVHRLLDPEIGDTLLVVTAPAPVRGLLKPQNFVEFHALASTQGLAVQPLADDVHLSLSPDKIVIGRPIGLTLSPSIDAARHMQDRSAAFDLRQWSSDRKADFFERQRALRTAAAAARADRLSAARLALAKFYMARGLYFEAKGALDGALAADHVKRDEADMYVLRAATNILSHRYADAFKDLAHGSAGKQNDARLWRALGHAEEGKWMEAREDFKDAESSIASLPIQLQRFALNQSIRSAIEVGDFNSASNELHDLETIGVQSNWKPRIALLRGRIAEGLGHDGEALAKYQTAAESNNRRAETLGRLYQTMLRYRRGELKRDDAIAALETISAIWRGDATEVEALHMLARLYTDEGRLREAFTVMRTSLSLHSASDLTRRIQDEAAATFEHLFLAGKDEKLSPVNALSLFYDFRELTPIGRRGDELIRHLADRLVSVDLLDQASQLLQHQVDHRLQGAARAEVAARLATIYLMNRKPDRALAVLRSTQIAELSNTLRRQRLLLEARALSELHRSDVALEVAANLRGREAERLRADILWSAKRWNSAAEAIEKLLGDRWRGWQPLDDIERADVLRAGIGFALGEDSIGLARLRERYAAKMADGPDGRAFDVITGPVGINGPDFRNIAGRVASMDTLEGFLRDMKAGFAGPVSGSTASQFTPSVEAQPRPETKAASTAGEAQGRRPERPPAL